MHVRMYVCLCGRIVHTGIDVRVSPDRCHAFRWVHVYLSPSVHVNLYVYGDPSIVRCSPSERHRDARAGVRSRRVRAWARPRGLHLP